MLGSLNRGNSPRTACLSAAASLACCLVGLVNACGSGSEESSFGNPEQSNATQPDGAAPAFGDAGVASDEPFRACATAEGEAQRVPVYLLVALDGSGSMMTRPNGTPSAKWQAAKDALDAMFSDLARRNDPSFAVGLTVFCDAHDLTCYDDPNNGRRSFAGPYDIPNVAVGIVDQGHQLALRQRIDATQPNLGTPAFEVLAGQLGFLERFQPAGPVPGGGRKVLVFISDGIPDEDMPKGRENPNDSDGEAKAAKNVVAAKASAVTTFSVGVGELSPLDPLVYDPRFMADIAVAGGAAKPGCSRDELVDEAKMCHFQITPGSKDATTLTSEFERALDSIRTSVLSCDYPLQRTTSSEALDPSKVNVVFTDGSGQRHALTQSTSDGWTFDTPSSPTRVHLNGSTCDRVKGDPGGKISIVLGCKTLLR